MDGREPVYVSEGILSKYIFQRLIDKGYAVTNEEAFALGEIFFDFLVENEVLEFIEEDED